MDSAGDSGKEGKSGKSPQVSHRESSSGRKGKSFRHGVQLRDDSYLTPGNKSGRKTPRSLNAEEGLECIKGSGVTMIRAPSLKSSAYPEMNKWYQQLSEGSLELFNMGLDAIPRSIFEYRQPLKIIYLQDNNIREVPRNFFDDLPYLAWCDLRFNEISTLPKFSKPHNALRVLLLQDNRLSSLPFSLGLFANKLKTLGLRGNPLIDPPSIVIEEGPDAIRAYLVHSWKREMSKPEELESTEQDEPQTGRQSRGSEASSPRKRHRKAGKRDKDFVSPRIVGRKNKDAPNFTKALYNSVLKARKTQSQNWGKQSSHISLFGNLMNDRAATNIQYTNDVWRDIPYDGMSQKRLINKSLEEMRSQILRKFANQRDAILQKIKDREVLAKWRFETRNLQKAGRRPGQCSLVINPPYGVSTDVVQDEEPNVMEALQYIHMGPEEFQQHVTDYSKKLQEFIEHPAPITDPDAAYRRLQEVEDIQRKLCCMKLSLKNPLPV